MFEQSLLENAVRGGWKKSLAVFASTIFQCCLLGVLALAPMLVTDTLPVRAWMTPIEPPPPLGDRSPAPPKAHSSTVVHRPPSDGGVTIPTMIPQHAVMITDPGPMEPVVIGSPGVPGGVPGMERTNWKAWLPDPPVKPPPAPVAPERKPADTLRRITIASIEPAMILDRPQPVYPHLAVISRIEGVVRFEAIISRAGQIENLRLIGGHPLLAPAAQEAVLRWRYKPTVLDGEPVEVVTLIEVKFSLSH